MASGTEAASLVNSYPLTKENYRKCMAHLQSRFAREELLIQVYVRELLALVYRKLETGLVAIKTKLGWTVQGQQVGVNVNTNFTTKLFCSNKNNDLTGYWSLETLGIRDPSEVKSKTETAAEVISSFQTYKDRSYWQRLYKLEVSANYHNSTSQLYPRPYYLGRPVVVDR
ncbi:hypothetical protein ACJJTC_011903 [Scirpophaga incertulas]